jgi:dynein heavy chain 1
VPRLINDDLPLLQSLLNNVFPVVKFEPYEIVKLKDEIKHVCNELNLVYGGSSSTNENISVGGSLWLEKVLQLYSISILNHGLRLARENQRRGKCCSRRWRDTKESRA